MFSGFQTRTKLIKSWRGAAALQAAERQILVFKVWKDKDTAGKPQERLLSAFSFMHRDEFSSKMQHIGLEWILNT